MNTIRASWWSLTINNPTEQDRQTLSGPAPRWLRVVKGQDEIGENGTVHIQACANTRQVRMSALKEWLPRAHIEVVRNVSAMNNYVNKVDTAIPNTQFEYNYVNNENANMTMADVLIRIAELADVNKTANKITDDAKEGKVRKLTEYYSEEYWDSVNILLGTDENLVALLTQPQYERAWVKTRNVWLVKVTVDRQTNISVAYESPAENILVKV